MTLTLVFVAAVVAAFLAGWKGIGLATKAKTAYSASRALTDAKKLIAKHQADKSALEAAYALVAAQPAATGPTGGIPKFLLPTGASAASVSGASGAANPTPAG